MHWNSFSTGLILLALDTLDFLDLLFLFLHEELPSSSIEGKNDFFADVFAILELHFSLTSLSEDVFNFLVNCVS